LIGFITTCSELAALADIEVSSCLIQTAGLAEGSKAHIVPLAASQIPYGLPNIKSVQEAVYVRLKEVPTASIDSKLPVDGLANGERIASRIRGVKSDQGRRREWLTLLVRELLG
jgi:hypothetical protein